MKNTNLSVTGYKSKYYIITTNAPKNDNEPKGVKDAFKTSKGSYVTFHPLRRYLYKTIM